MYRIAQFLALDALISIKYSSSRSSFLMSRYVKNLRVNLIYNSTSLLPSVDKLSANTNLLFIIGPGLLLIKQFVTKSNLFRETLHERVQ